jgi:hypothetical protein
MRKRIVTIACIGVLAVTCVIVLDLFMFRPSGVYSYTQGQAYGFEIGMTKEQAFKQITAMESGVQLRTREPFHMQQPFQPEIFENTSELKQSNYWILYAGGANAYLVLFQNGKVYRILGHIRRFGELETGLSMFQASHSNHTQEGVDIFAGLSQAEIDASVLEQEEWTKVFLH